MDCLDLISMICIQAIYSSNAFKQCIKALHQSNVSKALCESKKVYAFIHVSRQGPSDTDLCMFMQVAFYLIDLLQDTNAEVVKAADQALMVISETDEQWAAKLRALKFEAHNQIWLEACASASSHQVTFKSQ